MLFSKFDLDQIAQVFHPPYSNFQKQEKWLMLQYFFVHGWGNEPGFWQKTLPYFSEYGIHLVDLEFIKDSRKRIDSPLRPESKKIYVTHSLGTLWALKNRLKDIDALIVINGFFNFKPFADEQVLQTMKKRLESDPITQMGSFWRQCGISPENKDLNLKRLQEGMNWLIQDNATRELYNSSFPVLSLAADDDPILPINIMKHHWSGYPVRIAETGGHKLPWSQAEWCSNQIKEFVRDLKLEK